MAYTSIPFVNYWRIKKSSKPDHRNYVCFGQMRSEGCPDAVRYVAPLGKLNEGALDFYINFMVRILRRPESPKFMIRKLKGKVLYRLETKGLGYIHALFYLSWFRYVHEMPELVNELFARKVEGDSDETLFIKFQQIHDDAIAGKVRVAYNGISGHGLRYAYGGYSAADGYSAPNPITIERLVENIKKKPMTVHAYFA
jgi:hypothetical protein